MGFLIRFYPAAMSTPDPSLPALSIKRIYDPPSPRDGLRVLVDRLWPRGLRREQAQVQLWVKDVAPSPPLRRWFGHDPRKWEEFGARYEAELDANPQGLRALADALRGHDCASLLYAARDPVHNHAAVLLRRLRQGSAGDASQRARLRLLDEHVRLLDLLGAARQALLLGDLGKAREGLDELAVRLARHAAQEEAEWIARLDASARWPARVYLAEHRKLDSMMAELRQRLARAPARVRDARTRLQLVDSTLPFQHVMEHHFEREHQDLLAPPPGAPR